MGDNVDGSGIAGASAKACTLIPGDTSRTIVIGFDLWWLLLAAALLGSLRAVRVRANRRRR